MKSKMYSKDIILILIASFFYFSSPMLVTPLITGFTESLGAGGALMGIVGGLTLTPGISPLPSACSSLYTSLYFCCSG